MPAPSVPATQEEEAEGGVAGGLEEQFVGQVALIPASVVPPYFQPVTAESCTHFLVVVSVEM